MKPNVTVDWKTITAGGVVLVGLYLFAKSEAKSAVKTVAQSINPLDRENIFNRAVNSTGAALSGDQNWSLGGWIYDITHKTPDYSAKARR